MNQMKVTWSKDGTICRSDGICRAKGSSQLGVSDIILGSILWSHTRQAQSLFIENVPRVHPAAIIAPTYQLSLKRPLRTAVCRGYVSSAMSCDAPLIQNGMPIPRRIRATRNMTMLMEAVWMITPMRRITEPNVMLCFRPKRSLTYGTTGITMTAPMLKAALMRPRRAPFGLSKSISHRISKSLSA
jgi:hypothetical protein